MLVVESSCDVNESSGYHTLPCPSPTSLPVMPSSIEEEEEEETLVVSIPTEIWLKARDNKRRESSKVEIHSTLEEVLDIIDGIIMFIIIAIRSISFAIN